MTAAHKTAVSVMKQERRQQITDLSNRVFGQSPERVAFPGGKSRPTFIADMGSHGPFVFSKRENIEDAQAEGIVLKNLSHTSCVPMLKMVCNDWVVQQHIEGTRLPILLDRAENETERVILIGNALHDLVALHQEARSLTLQHRLPKLGVVKNWLKDRIDVVDRISELAGIQSPQIKKSEIFRILNVRHDEFSKWDSRPGNAMVTTSKTVWIDWEDCGRSKALNDLAVVLCDEWNGIGPESEEILIDKFLPKFNFSMSTDAANRYLHHFGIVHTLLRIRLAQKLYHRDGEWWDREYCLQGDKIGVTPTEMNKQLDRVAQWIQYCPEWKNLEQWVRAIKKRYRLPLD